MSFKAMKFRVKNEEHSRQIQKALFKMGYEWLYSGDNVCHTGSNYLFTNDCGDVTHSSDDDNFEFSDHVECEIECISVIVEVDKNAKRKQEIKEQIEKLTAELENL